MRTAVVAAASALFLLGAATPAFAAPVPGVSPAEPRVTVHRVGPVVTYRLVQAGTPENPDQVDGGSVRVSYTCHRGEAEGGFFAYSSTSFARGYADALPCDGERHTVTFPLGRGTGSPFTPARKLSRDAVGIDFGIGGQDVAGDNHRRWPVLVLFRGW